MKIGITQRVERVETYREKRDCLDQRWAMLLEKLGFIPIPVPNRLENVERYLLVFDIAGVILTGGNDLVCVPNGENTAPERDVIEERAVAYCREKKLPVLGVCRGAQLLAHLSGIPIHKVEGHVGVHALKGRTYSVKSFHRFGFHSSDVKKPWKVVVEANDGTAEAIVHETLPQLGVMWHPEREPASKLDEKILVEFFSEWKNMRVIILAAGQGTRLRPYTNDRPKCLVELGGQTLLERQIWLLGKSGYSDITVITGYRSDCIRKLGLRTIHNPNYDKCNMLASLMVAKNLLDGGDDVLISYGDILFDSRVCNLLRGIYTEGISIPVNLDWKRLWQLRMEDPLADAESLRWNSENHVTEIGNVPKSFEEVQGQYMGLTLLGKESVLRWVSVYESLTPDLQAGLSITPFLQRLLSGGEVVSVLPIAGGWLEVDSVDDLDMYRKMYAEGVLASYCNLDE